MTTHASNLDATIGRLEGTLIVLFSVALGATDVLLALSFASHRHEDLLALLAILFMVPIGFIAAATGVVSAPAPARIDAHVPPSTDLVRGQRVDNNAIAGY